MEFINTKWPMPSRMLSPQCICYNINYAFAFTARSAERGRLEPHLSILLQ